MARFDGSGPRGTGAMTGKGMGRCIRNRFYERGFGRCYVGDIEPIESLKEEKRELEERLNSINQELNNAKDE